VTARALFARVDRRLRRDGELLRRTAATGRAQLDLGAFYILDIARSIVTAHHVDLVALAKELDCLRPWERLVEA
jgi:hypothetical protein